MKEKFIRRQWVLLGIATALLTFFAGGAWYVYNVMFYPLAPPMHLPETAEISCITLTRLDGSMTEITDREEIQNIMSTIETAKPTRLWTVNDFPAVGNYGGLDLHTANRTETIFYYRDRGRWLLEQPYQGIYEVDEASVKTLP